MITEEQFKGLQKDHNDLWKWVSNLSSLVLCLVEDRLEDEGLTEDEKETYRELLKEI